MRNENPVCWPGGDSSMWWRLKLHNPKDERLYGKVGLDINLNKIVHQAVADEEIRNMKVERKWQFKGMDTFKCLGFIILKNVTTDKR